jgi:hypothetical protein
MKTKPTHEQIKRLYAQWIFEECSSPIDEIIYLFDYLPVDHKEQIEGDMLTHYNLNNY